MTAPLGKTVWIMNKSGVLEKVAVIDDGGSLQNFSRVEQKSPIDSKSNFQSSKEGSPDTALPKSTAGLDPNLPYVNRFKDWAENIEPPLSPSTVYYPPKPVQASIISDCPKVEPQWLKVEPIPPEPEKPRATPG